MRPNFQPRQYPRVPLITPVRVEGHGHSVLAYSVQLGAGGMALENATELNIAEPVTVNFALPDGTQVSVHGVVWWKRGKHAGIRFDPADHNRGQVRAWVESLLSEKTAPAR